MTQDYERWKAMGDEIKEIRNRLLKFQCNPDYQRLVTVKMMDGLDKAVARIDDFRCRAENRMFKTLFKGRPLPEDVRKWHNMFYGRDASDSHRQE